MKGDERRRREEKRKEIDKHKISILAGENEIKNFCGNPIYKRTGVRAYDDTSELLNARC
mgnify:CR=1 FL=1